jgi:hypothetical protein
LMAKGWVIGFPLGRWIRCILPIRLKQGQMGGMGGCGRKGGVLRMSKLTAGPSTTFGAGRAKLRSG